MFKLIRKRINLLKQFFPILVNTKKYYFTLSICAVITTALAYVNPEFYKLFINNIIIGKDIGLIPVVFGGYLLVYVLSTGLEYIQFSVRNKFLNVSLFSLKCRILHNILHRPISLDKLDSSELKLRIEDDIVHINLFIEDQTIDYVLSAIKIALSVVLLYVINVYLATYAIIIIPITILFENIVGKKKGKYINIIRNNQQQTNSWLQNIIYGWRSVKSLNLQDMEMQIYQEYLDVFCENNRKWMNLWVLSNRVFPRLKDEFLMKILLYFFGGLLIANQGLSIGSLLVFIIYYEMLRASINNFASKDSQLLESLPYLERLLQEYESSEQCKQKGETYYHEISFKSEYDIRLQNVSFKYENTDVWLFRSLHLHIEKGDIIAVTGKSGIGKSTLIKLITGIELPSEGVVFLNGIDIRNISTKAIYKDLGVVMQDSILFNTTIIENLQYSRTVSEQEVIEACRKACILDDINDMPNGFNTIIGENGMMLSGGQKQRLVLARQFLRKSKILVLDEATSSVDPYTEAKIFENIKGLASTHIIIIISHRPTPLTICNRFVSFDASGQISISEKGRTA
jgi:ABC-type bacteriocin/lantibiotic exporter with double-glycine peptidase domain